MKKRVEFDESQNKTYETYSMDEYDRLPIDSILYLYGYNKVTQQEWIAVHVELNKFKSTEMIVHKSSIQNLRLHSNIFGMPLMQ